MIIIGIDPGYAIVGYGVIRAQSGRYQPLDFGAITTPAGMEFGQRLVRIYEETKLLLAKAWKGSTFRRIKRRPSALRRPEA